MTLCLNRELITWQGKLLPLKLGISVRANIGHYLAVNSLNGAHCATQPLSGCQRATGPCTDSTGVMSQRRDAVTPSARLGDARSRSVLEPPSCRFNDDKFDTDLDGLITVLSPAERGFMSHAANVLRDSRKCRAVQYLGFPV